MFGKLERQIRGRFHSGMSPEDVERERRRAAIKASTINGLVDGASWLSRFNVAPGFGMVSTAAGPVIYDARPRPMWVKLVGNANPYEWKHAFNDGAGGFADLTGDVAGEAYEANGRTGLDGAVVPIEMTGEAWWVFYVPAGLNQCDPDNSEVCVEITSDGCSGGVAYGTLVTVKDSTDATVGTCTATGQVISVTRTSGGSGYTNGTGYALGFSGGGGTGAAGTFDVVGGVVVNLQRTAAGSGYTSAPTLSFPGAGAGTGASATAAVRAICCLPIASGGTYTVTAAIPGASTVSTTVGAVCGTSTTALLSFPASSLGTACITFTHCGYANGGDTIVISKAGTPVATVTTGPAGTVCFRLGTGSYTYALTTPQGSTKAGSFSVSGCTTTNVNAGFSVANFCAHIRTAAPAGCTGTITLKNQDTGVTLGSGSITTTDNGFGFITGSVCFDIPEFVMGTIGLFSITIAFPNFTTVVTDQPVACYSAGGPFFAAVNEGFGAPC